MKFTASTRLPISALGPLAKLKEHYACGPLLELDEAQRAMLEEFDDLYPAEKLRVANAALSTRRDHITGADLFALERRPAETEAQAA